MSLFGDIGTLFGGGNENSSFSAQGAPIMQTVDPNQLSTAYGQTQSGLAQQQGLIGALNAQNGIGNQNQVYGQLQGVANGTGPNPAQAMLAQQTGNNIAAQGALAAGQRGAGANVGLMARQIGQQGAATQQQAVGQGATLQAQQSLGALGQLGGMANQQAAQQIGAVGNYNQLAQGQQGQLLGAAGQLNSANVGMQSNINNANQSMANTNANNAASTIGGLTGGLSAAGGNLASSGGSLGGALTAAAAFSHGGMVADNIPPHFHELASLYQHHLNAPFSGKNPKSEAVAPKDKYAHGGKVDAMVSPGEKYLKPGQVKQFAKGDKDVVKKAEKIDGKAKVAGDSETNDTVKKKLAPGGVVVPRTAVEKDNGKSFVAALLNKHAEEHQKAGEEDFKNALKKGIASRGKK